LGAKTGRFVLDIFGCWSRRSKFGAGGVNLEQEEYFGSRRSIL